MNALIEIEASEFSQLFKSGDALSIRMFMEHVHMPLDVQDKIYNEISALAVLEQDTIARLIETHKGLDEAESHALNARLSSNSLPQLRLMLLAVFINKAV